MKFALLPSIAAASALFLTSCGEEKPAAEQEKPTFEDTKPTAKTPDPEGESSGRNRDQERGDRPEGDRGSREGGDRRRGFDFAERDTDGDGALNREEMGDMGWLMMRRSDTDGDGKITEEEMRIQRESGNFQMPQPADFVEVLDKDGDGKLAIAELPDRMRDRMADNDLDGDGQITIEEMETRRAEREAERALNGEPERSFGRGPGGGDRGGDRRPGGGGGDTPAGGGTPGADDL